MGGAKIMSFAHPPLHQRRAAPHRRPGANAGPDAPNDRMFLFWQGIQIHDWYLTTGDPKLKEIVWQGMIPGRTRRRL